MRRRSECNTTKATRPQPQPLNEENARLRKELELLKALSTRNTNVPEAPGSQLIQCHCGRGLLLAQKDFALLEIQRLRNRLNAKHATIKSLEIDTINKNN